MHTTDEHDASTSAFYVAPTLDTFEGSKTSQRSTSKRGDVVFEHTDIAEPSDAGLSSTLDVIASKTTLDVIASKTTTSTTSKTIEACPVCDSLHPPQIYRGDVADIATPNRHDPRTASSTRSNERAKVATLSLRTTSPVEPSMVWSVVGVVATSKRVPEATSRDCDALSHKTSARRDRRVVGGARRIDPAAFLAHEHGGIRLQPIPPCSMRHFSKPPTTSCSSSSVAYTEPPTTSTLFVERIEQRAEAAYHSPTARSAEGSTAPAAKRPPTIHTAHTFACIMHASIGAPHA